MGCRIYFLDPVQLWSEVVSQSPDTMSHTQPKLAGVMNGVSRGKVRAAEVSLQEREVREWGI